MPSRKHKPSSPLLARLFAFTITFGILFSLQSNAGATGNDTPIRIAILPCTDIVKTYTQAQPLRVYLQKILHRQIEILVPNTFQEFKKTIQIGEADFAFQAPHTYLMLADQYDQKNLLLALTPDGKSSHCGVIVVKKDSGIKTVSDLRGKKVLFGHLFSTAKWLAPKSLLEDNGIDLGKDLKDYAHGGSCESIAMNIYLGLADAGTMCDYALDDLTENKTPKEDEIPPDALSVIGTTWEIPTWVFTAHKNIDKETVSKVTDALLNLDRHSQQYSEILENMELGGFTHAKASDFDSLKKHLSAAAITDHL